MTKNIAILDMQGNVYGATYPKRARGLVKKGRACFVNGSTIRLACPPSEMEDDNMKAMTDRIDVADDRFDTIHDPHIQAAGTLEGPEEDLVQHASVEQSASAGLDNSMEQEIPAGLIKGIGSDASSGLDGSYLIEKIDQILADTSYLQTALTQLEDLTDSRAAAAVTMVEARERTNLRMIDFLEKMMGKMELS